MDRDDDFERSQPLVFAPAPDEIGSPESGSGVGRRLVVGFVISCVLGGLCWGVLPRFGVWVPAWLPLGGFGLIMLASLIAGYENARDDENGSGGPGGQCGVDEGRPICCSGPRPMKMLRD